METRAKAVRKMILPSAVNLETSEKDYNEEEIYCKEEDISDTYCPSEMEEDSSEDNEPPIKKKARRSTSPLTRKNLQWFNKPSQRTFTHLSSVNFNAKGKGTAEHISSPIEAWSLLFSDDLLNIILKHTNQEIECDLSKCNSYNNSLLDMNELKALIGFLYYTGYKKKNNDISKFFSVHCLPMFRALTSNSRYQFILAHLLFDDKTTRDERIKNDCFTRIREIWNLFITNCIQYYEPGYNVTIDELLLNFTGRYTDNLRISSKYSKRGLKIVTMCDSETFYMINAIPDISNVETEPLESFPSYYVRKVSEPIHNTCRNITCGTWFTSVPLVDTMREKFSLTMVGSLRRDEIPEVPSSFKKAFVKGRYQVAYHDNKTLVSYKTEKNKMILLLSSLHANGDIKIENKPEIVLYYNKTKEASNIFEQLCHEYTVSRKTHRWPIRIFYGMMDQAAVNSFVLYTLNADNQVMTRDKFMLDLSMTLIKPYFIERLSRPNVHISAKYLIKAFLDEHGFGERLHNLRLDISNKLDKQTSCHICYMIKRRFTIYKCLKCNIPMCKKHTAKICQSCAEDKFFKHLY